MYIYIAKNDEKIKNLKGSRDQRDSGIRSWH